MKPKLDGTPPSGLRRIPTGSKTTSPATNGKGQRKCTSWTGLSVERLKEILDYNPVTGIFKWKIQISRACKVGDIAGTDDDGYIRITIAGVRYYAHTLAWLFIYRVVVKLDHKDRIRSHNWITNLRPANAHQNGGNRSSSGVIGLKGVTQRGEKFIAQITVNYINTYLGTFDNAEEAAAVYKVAAKEAFGEFADD